jgi:hypothetical protein
MPRWTRERECLTYRQFIPIPSLALTWSVGYSLLDIEY